MTWDPSHPPSRSQEKSSPQGTGSQKKVQHLKAERFKVKNVATLEEKFLHLHYKEHLIPINGGRGNLFNEELKVTLGGREGKGRDCFV